MSDVNAIIRKVHFGRSLNSGIERYDGSWSDDQLFHLFRRTMFGLSQEQRLEFGGMSMDEAVTQLLTPVEDPPVPVNDYNTSEITDPDVLFGESWIEDTTRDNDVITSARVVSLKGWFINNLMSEKLSLHEKMIFFWHNHLATQAWEVYWPNHTYHHLQILRTYAFGNFKELVKKVTLDPQMLLYLNGAANRNEAPDENYARELQELFCVGKGEGAQFTESDVQEAARVLTGHSIDWEKGGFYLYRPYWHDTGDKQFSEFYGNKMIGGKSGEDGKSEVDELLEMIFDTNEVSHFIIRKLYRFFVYSDIDDLTETLVIEPLAKIFRDNNYEILPVLEVLFRSQHFYDVANHGAMIKSPLDFLVGFWRSTGTKMPSQATETNKREIRSSMLWTMGNQGLEVLDPPGVSGFPAYYQFPQFDKSWITTNSVTNRALVTDSFVYWGFWSENLLTTVDLLDHIDSFESASDPVKLVDDLIGFHLAYPVSQDVKNRMLLILLSGQISTSYWTDAWLQFKARPDDEMKRNTVEIRAKVMFQFLFQLSEYHLL